MAKDNINVKGKIVIDSEKNYGQMNIHGKLQSIASITADSVCINGKVEIAADLNVNKFSNISGKITIKRLSGNNVNLKGQLNIGEITGNRVEIVSTGDSIVTDIHADSIVISSKTVSSAEATLGNLISNFFGKQVYRVREGDSFQVKCTKITGCDVKLSHVIADEVIGENVSIDSGCEINVLKYKNRYSCHETSKINKVVKL